MQNRYRPCRVIIPGWLQYLCGRVSELFPDDVEDGLLDVEEAVLGALHAGQLRVQHPQLLHLEDLVVAGAVVEGVGPLREVVHHVGLAEDRDPGRVAPRHEQRVVRDLGALRRAHCEWSLKNAKRWNIGISR